MKKLFWLLLLVPLMLVIGGCPGPDVPPDPGIKPKVRISVELDPTATRVAQAGAGLGAHPGLIVVIESDEDKDVDISIPTVLGPGVHPVTKAAVDSPFRIITIINLDGDDFISSPEDASARAQKSSDGTFDQFGILPHKFNLPARGTLHLQFIAGVLDSFVGENTDPAIQDFPSGGQASLVVPEVKSGLFTLNDLPLVSPKLTTVNGQEDARYYSSLPDFSAGNRTNEPCGIAEPTCAWIRGTLNSSSSQIGIKYTQLSFEGHTTAPSSIDASQISLTFGTLGFANGQMFLTPFANQPNVGVSAPVVEILSDRKYRVTYTFDNLVGTRNSELSYELAGAIQMNLADSGASADFQQLTDQSHFSWYVEGYGYDQGILDPIFFDNTAPVSFQLLQ